MCCPTHNNLGSLDEGGCCFRHLPFIGLRIRVVLVAGQDQVSLHWLESVLPYPVTGQVVPQQAGEALGVEGAVGVGETHESSAIGVVAVPVLVQLLKQQPLSGGMAWDVLQGLSISLVSMQ